MKTYFGGSLWKPSQLPVARPQHAQLLTKLPNLTNNNLTNSNLTNKNLTNSNLTNNNFIFISVSV